MKKTILFFTSLLFFVFSSSQAAPTLTGKELLDNCEIALDILDNNSGRVTTEREYTAGFKSGICQGYILSANEIYSKEGKCVIPELSMLKTIAIVVKYLKDHPEQSQSSALSAVLKVYESYFPCRHLNSKSAFKSGNK